MASAVESMAASWARGNAIYLRAERERLRLLFARRVLWLRRHWQQDALGDSRGLAISEAFADRLLAGEDVESEARFYREAPEAAAIGRRLDALEADLAERRGRLPEQGGLPAVEALTRLFGLSPFDRDLLLLSLAVEEDASFAWLCGYAQDDVRARYPTLDLAASLFCLEAGAREDARAALAPSAPLRRHLLGWVEGAAGTPGSLRPLRIEDRVADYVRGRDRLDESVAHLLRPVPPVPLADAHEARVEGLLRRLQAAAPDRPWPAFQLVGPPDAGMEAVAAEVCARLGVELYALDARRLPVQDAERHALLHVMQREIILSRLAVYLDVGDVDAADRPVASAARDWIEEYGGVLFVGSRERWPVQRSAVHVAVPKPDRAAQRALWKRSLDGVRHSVDGQLDGIVQQFDLGPQAIAQVVGAALGKAQQYSPESPAVTAANLWEACREQVGWRLGDLAQRLHPGYGWEDIVLPEDVHRQLREIADQVAARAHVYERWGFGSRLARGRGISALFSGPSGTGKTMAAEIIARHLQLDLYRIDLAGVVSKYIGETEKNLRAVFDAAEQSGAILFFDEADALFGKRSEVKDSHDRYANIEVNYLLQRMEDYRGLAILCTNRRAALDRAFLRRLRFVVEFPFPDWAHRRAIWQKVFPREAPLGALDFEALSRLEVSGGNIRNIALNAAFLAAGQATAIGMEHVLHAARREYAKIDRLMTESEFGSPSTPART